MKVTTSILATTIVLFATRVAADAPVVTMTMPYMKGSFDALEFAGSVIEAGPSGTTMAVACNSKGGAATTAVDNILYCHLWESATFVASPSTFSMEIYVEAEEIETAYTHHVGCDIQSASHAVCTETEVFAPTLTATEYQQRPERTVTTNDLSMVPVTITAGADKLSATQTASGAEPTSEPTGTETGSAPRITGAARWAVGGMAAVALAAAA